MIDGMTATAGSGVQKWNIPKLITSKRATLAWFVFALGFALYLFVNVGLGIFRIEIRSTPLS